MPSCLFAFFILSFRVYLISQGVWFLLWSPAIETTWPQCSSLLSEWMCRPTRLCQPRDSPSKTRFFLYFLSFFLKKSPKERGHISPSYLFLGSFFLLACGIPIRVVLDHFPSADPSTPTPLRKPAQDVCHDIEILARLTRPFDQGQYSGVLCLPSCLKPSSWTLSLKWSPIGLEAEAIP